MIRAGQTARDFLSGRDFDGNFLFQGVKIDGKIIFFGLISWWGGGESQDPLAKQQNRVSNTTKSHKNQQNARNFGAIFGGDF